jgi:hypothetical protein
MGNEMMATREVGRTTAVANDADAQPAAPGKRTLIDHLAASHGIDTQLLAKHVGARVPDGGGFTFEIQHDLGFRLVEAPRDRAHSIGVVFATSHAVWRILAGIATRLAYYGGLQIHSGLDATADAAADAGRKCRDGLWANSKKNAHGLITAFAPETPLAIGDIARYNGTHAQIRGTRTKLGQGTIVRIKNIDGTNILVDKLDSLYATTGSELGWTIFSQAFQRIPRPARPSTPAQQMAALYGAAKGRSSTSGGNCFHNIKDAIVLAGGYGDILDFNNDPRFDPGVTTNGPLLHAAIQAIGAERLGLELVSAPVWSAKRGSLLLTRGNGGKPARGNPELGKNGISNKDGDAAVIEGVSGDLVIAYNDGRMPLSADPKQWDAGGVFENTVVAIYQPIARP